jgi:uncharacterized membrane protein
MQVFTDKQLDLAIGKLLRYGVIVSAVLAAFGGILYLKHPLTPAPNITISSRRALLFKASRVCWLVQST